MYESGEYGNRRTGTVSGGEQSGRYSQHGEPAGGNGVYAAGNIDGSGNRGASARE